MKTLAKGSIVHGRETTVCQCAIAGSVVCLVHPMVRPMESLEIVLPDSINQFNVTMATRFGSSGLWELFLVPDGNILGVFQ